MLILTLVATASVTAYAARRRHLDQARGVTLAYQALANEAEHQRRIPFAQLKEGPSGFLSDTSLLAPLTPYGATVRVEKVRTEVRNVVMTVRWQTGRAELVVVRADTGGSPLW